MDIDRRCVDAADRKNRVQQLLGLILFSDVTIAPRPGSGQEQTDYDGPIWAP